MSRRPTNPALLLRYFEWGIRAGVVAPVLGLLVGLQSLTTALTVMDVVLLAVWALGILSLDWWARWSIDRLFERDRSVSQRRQLVAASVVAATSIVVTLLTRGGEWGAIASALTGFMWLGCLVLVVRLWQLAVIIGVTLVVSLSVTIAVQGFTEAGGFSVGILLVTVPVLLGLWWVSGWQLRVLHELQQARDAAAQAAVSEERARISRDLHDVFGQTLAAIAVKSELAAELASRGRAEAAAAEMRSVHELADRAGTKVRAVVRGENLVDLPGEIDGARALLAAAQIDCRVNIAPVSVPDDVLAWVLRESVTNILRHSQATATTIDLTAEDGLVRLRVANDGAAQAADPLTGDRLTGVPLTDAGDLLNGAGAGDLLTGAGGLGGIAARVDAAGGSVRVEHADGWFILDAAVPAQRENGEPIGVDQTRVAEANQI